MQGPNYKTDGCSSVPDYVFFDACAQHDFGYRNLPLFQQFRSEKYRRLADERFYSNMKARCDSKYGSWYEKTQRKYCKGVAYAYFIGVTKITDGGSDAFFNTKAIYN